MFTDSRVFEMMTLAQDMGMDKLKMECEDHVISTMKGNVSPKFIANTLHFEVFT